MKKSIFLLVSVFLFLVSGCQGSTPQSLLPNTNQNRNVSQNMTGNPNQQQGNNVSSSNFIGDMMSKSPKISSLMPNFPKSMPVQLEKISYCSDDIIDNLNNNNWAKCNQRLKTLKDNMTELKPIISGSNAPNSLVAALNNTIVGLDKEVNSKNPINAKNCANRINKYVADISDSYKNTVPADVGRLNYCGRQIGINLEKNDWVSAKSNCSTAKKTWNALKSKLDSTYAREIKKCDQIVNKLNSCIKAKNVSGTKLECNNLVDQTSVIKQCFNRQQAK